MNGAISEGKMMDQAKFNGIREGAKALKAAREAAEAASIAAWAEEYEAMVMREGGPDKYFGPMKEYKVEDLLAIISAKARR